MGLDDPALTAPTARDGALSRGMACGHAPRGIWQLDRLDQWHQVLAGVCFSSDWNAPHPAGLLRPPVLTIRPGCCGNGAVPFSLCTASARCRSPSASPDDCMPKMPGSTLAEIPDPAHMAHFDQPRAWVEAVQAFLRPLAGA